MIIDGRREDAAMQEERASDTKVGSIDLSAPEPTKTTTIQSFQTERIRKSVYYPERARGNSQDPLVGSSSSPHFFLTQSNSL